MRVVDKTKALGALAGVPRARNEGGSAQRVTSGIKVSTAARGRQIARAALGEFRPGALLATRCRALSGGACGMLLDRWLAHLLRRRLEARLPRRVR